MTQTYWNGAPAEAVRCVVRVGKSPRDSWWCVNLEGQERDAVRVTHDGQATFFLDDQDDKGWYKVTEGRGSPWIGHNQLPDSSEVLRLRDE